MFKKIKEKWQKKIEKNAFKSTLSYTDRFGKIYTEEVYLKRSQPPFFEKFGDWARIYPPINENGKLNLVNLLIGGWRNAVKLLVFLLIVGMVFFQFKENFYVISQLREQLVFCQPVLLP